MSKEEEGLSLVEIHGRGRALVASQPLRGGQIVLRDSPILLYPAFPLVSVDESSHYCSHCFKKLEPERVVQVSVSCPDCSLERFCSPNCASSAVSSSHSPWLCQSLLLIRRHSSSLSLSLDLQLQARFLLAAYNLALLNPSHFQTLLSLQGDSTAIGDETPRFLHSLISSVCATPPPPVGWFSLELSAALLGKDKLNAFGLMEPFSENAPRSVRAYGIYPKASSFNHDCLPNACRFDYVDSDNTDMVVRMIHDVPQGREICLSYFPVNQNYASRQRRLMEDYGFACDCDRCKVEAQWSDNDDNEEEQQEEQQEEEEEELMEEDVDQTMEAEAEGEAGSAEPEFPHAYFFVRYMCNRNNCWGTLAPLPPSSTTTPLIVVNVNDNDNVNVNVNVNVMECNVCGNLKNDDHT
ncbi:SET domain containing protein [Trema orientale]|uniref:SET domain containing protein n=1 Tax=Trema orientale TaxID=63057 RepID=A0A2P5F1V1_TREOI|nr:SET domain containing protein [Trema orientale]